ncbi:hypothetical protein OYC64_012773 [Pagothenia borchgrevinki]|uniref:Uncharacterized protein n=1 Tax=Pagothenia borchgrevinki TaxID=8213 RepID=A0ABD2FS41_PAGBO
MRQLVFKLLNKRRYKGIAGRTRTEEDQISRVSVDLKRVQQVEALLWISVRTERREPPPLCVGNMTARPKLRAQRTHTLLDLDLDLKLELNLLNLDLDLKLDLDLLNLDLDL